MKAELRWTYRSLHWSRTGSSDSSTDDVPPRSFDTKTEREGAMLALETKIVAAWVAVKNLNKRPSLFRRRMQSQQDIIELANRAGQDVGDGIFCDSIMQLMHQRERYDHLDTGKTPRSKSAPNSSCSSQLDRDPRPKAKRTNETTSDKPEPDRVSGSQ